MGKAYTLWTLLSSTVFSLVPPSCAGVAERFGILILTSVSGFPAGKGRAGMCRFCRWRAIPNSRRWINFGENWSGATLLELRSPLAGWHQWLMLY